MDRTPVERHLPYRRNYAEAGIQTMLFLVLVTVCLQLTTIYIKITVMGKDLSLVREAITVLAFK